MLFSKLGIEEARRLDFCQRTDAAIGVELRAFFGVGVISSAFRWLEFGVATGSIDGTKKRVRSLELQDVLAAQLQLFVPRLLETASLVDISSLRPFGDRVKKHQPIRRRVVVLSSFEPL